MTSCNLLELSESGGCGCKIPPNMLGRILKTTSQNNDAIDPNLLLGFETSDDCAVYNFGDKHLLFSTDFFSSTVNSPYLFGKIAAANALSDIYATGGKPLIVNSILAFPPEDIPMPYVEDMIKGAQEVLTQCNAKNVGGHTIKNAQPLYGFAVIGEAQQHQIKRNNTPQVGDLVIITKPIGIGVLSNALKMNLLNEDALPEHTIEYITRVNKIGYELGKLSGVHSMTDITGFGLIGHLSEMVENSNFDVSIDTSDIPLIDGVKELCIKATKNPSGTFNNISRYAKYLQYKNDISEELKLLLHDPQTNGGLLITVDQQTYESQLAALSDSYPDHFHVIGQVNQGSGKIILK
ncbi:selenide, water dikinase SelD [Pseudoalteromonas luteoviolacea]|uniref:selenide, water dikinase SelD n=1 Tax=Pseudoalteromonas luteoviolacea TaxID=43657 RepID=UPI0023B2B8AD|nr:selenide, water dikinase SelD [Pseudoalteromonas luteoviolacea]